MSRLMPNVQTDAWKWGGKRRLKQAMMARQDDEEDGVRWRVEAEVRLAVDRAQQAAAQQEAQMHKDMADLQVSAAGCPARVPSTCHALHMTAAVHHQRGASGLTSLHQRGALRRGTCCRLSLPMPWSSSRVRVRILLNGGMPLLPRIKRSRTFRCRSLFKTCQIPKESSGGHSSVLRNYS